MEHSRRERRRPDVVTCGHDDGIRVPGLQASNLRSEIFHAAGRYYSAKVEASTSATTYGPATTTVNWQAYIDGQGWTREYGTPEEALAELADVRLHETKVEDIGAVPVATSGDTEPPAAPAPSASESFAADF